MLAKFNGIELYYNDEKIINSEISVKISYLTALFFLNDENIFSLYPEYLTVKDTEEVIIESLQDNSIVINKEDALTISKWIKERI